MRVNSLCLIESFDFQHQARLWLEQAIEKRIYLPRPTYIAYAEWKHFFRGMTFHLSHSYT